MKTPRLYKWLNTDGSCIWGEGAWKLPSTKDRGARPMPRLRGRLEVCTYGYHAFEAADLKSLEPEGDAMLAEVDLFDAAKLDGKWVGHGGRVLRVLFTTDALAEYHRVIGPAMDEYDRVVDQARAEYHRVIGPARAEYDRVIDRPRAEYNRLIGPALADYDRVIGPAMDEYDRVVDQARAEYHRVIDQALAAVA